jgi:diadenylate cyclase
VFFPMPDTKMLDKSMGSRHRAALGITEETDAVVVVVSEERGTISFCFNGNIVPNLDGASLKQALLGLFGQRARGKKKSQATPIPGSKRPSMATTGSFRVTSPGERTTPLTTGTTGSFQMRASQVVVPADEDSVPMRVSDPGVTRPMPSVETPVPMTPSIPPPPPPEGKE